MEHVSGTCETIPPMLSFQGIDNPDLIGKNQGYGMPFADKNPAFRSQALLPDADKYLVIMISLAVKVCSRFYRKFSLPGSWVIRDKNQWSVVGRCQPDKLTDTTCLEFIKDFCLYGCNL